MLVSRYQTSVDIWDFDGLGVPLLALAGCIVGSYKVTQKRKYNGDYRSGAGLRSDLLRMGERNLGALLRVELFSLCLRCCLSVFLLAGCKPDLRVASSHGEIPVQPWGAQLEPWSSQFA